MARLFFLWINVVGNQVRDLPFVIDAQVKLHMSLDDCLPVGLATQDIDVESHNMSSRRGVEYPFKTEFPVGLPTKRRNGLKDLTEKHSEHTSIDTMSTDVFNCAYWILFLLEDGSDSHTRAPT
jgi:hypothetical protein